MAKTPPEQEKSTLPSVVESETLPNIVQPTPMMLISEAMANGVAIADLERLFDLHDRMEKQRQKEAFYRAMANFQAEIPVIIKTKTVDYATKNDGRVTYKYAPMDSIDAQTKQARANNGLSHRFEIDESEKPDIVVTMIITHREGHSESTSKTVQPDTSGKKNQIQSHGSALQYAYRYLFTGGYGISTADEDDDGRARGSEEPATKVSGEEIDILRESLSRLFHNPDGIMQIKIAGRELEDLNQAQFANFRDFVNAYDKVLAEKKLCDEAGMTELYDFYANIHKIDDAETAKPEPLNKLAWSLRLRRRINDSREALGDKIFDAVVGDYLLSLKVTGLDSLINDKMQELLDILIKTYNDGK